MHKLSASFVLGYHGCDRSVGERLLGGEAFAWSENDHDWLGWGIYFWEANPLRGLEFAEELKRRRRGKHNEIKEAFVVGAVIDCGFCLDLLTSTGVEAVLIAYEDFKSLCDAGEIALPKNELGFDLLKRNLDCAVINHLHALRRRLDQPGFDTVRGAFREGEPIYENAGFHHKTHLQLCVRNSDSIKGVFRVPDSHLQRFGLASA